MARKLKGDCGARKVGEFCGWVRGSSRVGTAQDQLNATYKICFLMQKVTNTGETITTQLFAA